MWPLLLSGPTWPPLPVLIPQQDIVAHVAQAVRQDLQFQQVPVFQPHGVQAGVELLGPLGHFPDGGLFLGRVLRVIGRLQVLELDFLLLCQGVLLSAGGLHRLAVVGGLSGPLAPPLQ